jgi:type I restriction enzyme S subunit
MESNWPEYPLTDFYDISSGLSKPASDFGRGYPFVSFKDVFGNYFLPDELVQLVQSTDQERKKCSVKRGDVFLTRTSETMHELGMSSVALRDYENATFNGFTKRLRPKPDCDLVPEYVGYYLRSPRFRHSMLAFSTMSTRASLNNEMIGRLTIEVPPRPVQKSIAHVLKTLDEKVALNRQMNETLEQMAQALFKSWFVDFDPVIDNALDAGNSIPEELEARAEQRRQLRDAVAQGEASVLGMPDEIRSRFPSEFELTDEMGWIPKGWKVSTTHDEFEIKGGSTPSTKNPDFWEGGDINWTSPKDLSGKADKVLLDTERKITRQGLGKITSGLLPVDTVLMSSRAPVGYLALAKVPVAINQGYIALICNKTITPEYSIQWLSSVMDEIKSISGGTTFSEISKKTFRSIKLVVPVEGVVTEYTKYVAEYYQRIAQAVKESDSLSALRDYLLPKLISGELQIPDAEQQIAEVMS